MPRRGRARRNPLKLFTSPDGARRSNPLPAGTASVAVGLVVAGVTAYAFLIVADHALGKDATAPLAAIWAVTFTAAPGFFLPLEQEVSRAVASRRARGVGAGPVIKRASLLGLGLLGILLVSCAAAAPVITDTLFDGQWLLFAALLIGVCGYCAGHIARGLLSGRGRFGPYAMYIGGEATFRLIICIALAVLGVKTAGGYGLAIGIAPVLAVAMIAGRAWPDVHDPGPPAPWHELTPSLGALLAASVFAQGLMNAAMIAAKLLANESQQGEVKRVFNGVIVARVPLFLFQAVQAALLPRLASLASAGRFHEFRHSLKRLLEAVTIIAILGALGGFVLGPLAVRLAFKDVRLGHLDVGMLAAGTGFFIVGMSIAQALIALGGQGRVAVAWFGGVIVFVVAAALGHDLLLRLEVAACIAPAAACATLGLFLWQRMRAAEAEEDLQRTVAVVG